MQDERLRSQLDRIRYELRSQQRLNRQLKGFVALMVLALVVALNMGARRPTQIQRAERYELVDENGEVRGEMGTWGDTPYLRLRDGDGGGITMMSSGGDASISMFTDSPSHPRVHVRASQLGSSIALLDTNGNARARVEVDRDGRTVELHDRAGAHHIVLDNGRTELAYGESHALDPLRRRPGGTAVPGDEFGFDPSLWGK